MSQWWRIVRLEETSVKRRDDILSKKNEQNVSAIEGDGMELSSGEGYLP